MRCYKGEQLDFTLQREGGIEAAELADDREHVGRALRTGLQQLGAEHPWGDQRGGQAAPGPQP